MNDEQLRIGVEAAYKAARQQVIIVGSQAILGTYSAVVLPEKLTLSGEMDATPRLQFDGASKEDVSAAVERINNALGEDSPFSNEHGFWVEGVYGDTIIFPDGWENRLETYWITEMGGARVVAGWCLSPLDVCVAKVLAGRPHDNDYVIELVKSGLVDVDEVLSLVRGPIDWGSHECDQRRIDNALELIEFVRKSL